MLKHIHIYYSLYTRTHEHVETLSRYVRVAEKVYTYTETLHVDKMADLVAVSL